MRLGFYLFGILLLLADNVHSQSSGVIEAYSDKDSSYAYFVNNNQLYLEGWDTLAQPIFWKKVMAMSPDSCVVNVAATREVLFETSYWSYKNRSTKEKLKYKDSIRLAFCLEHGTKIYLTSGKKEFYNIEKVMPSIS